MVSSLPSSHLSKPTDFSSCRDYGGGGGGDGVPGSWSRGSVNSSVCFVSFKPRTAVND